LVLRPFELAAQLWLLLILQIFVLLPLLGPPLSQRIVGFLEPTLCALQISLLGDATAQQAGRQHTHESADAPHMPHDSHGTTTLVTSYLPVFTTR